MSARTEVPDRRPQALFDFALDPLASGPGAVTFTTALGWTSGASMRRGDDPVEVFVSCNKSTAVEALARDVGILVSLLRQHGCGFDAMRAAVTRLDDGVHLPAAATAAADDGAGTAASTSPSAKRGPPASLVGRLLDEIETFTREEAVALAGTGL